jgi:ribA/ribD-fused uncharacterized protein
MEAEPTSAEADRRHDLVVAQYKKRWTATPVEKAAWVATKDSMDDVIAIAHEAQDEEAKKKLKPVLFYGPKKGLYWSFSNFYTAPSTLDGDEWPTVEHYYVAQKNPDPEWQKQVRLAATPGITKRMGRQVELRDSWDDLKYDVMLKAVTAKFKQHPELAALLLSTGDRPIHENSSDPWWGGGPNYPGGRNWLGDILVEVRTLLRGDS